MYKYKSLLRLLDEIQEQQEELNHKRAKVMLNIFVYAEEYLTHGPLAGIACKLDYYKADYSTIYLSIPLLAVKEEHRNAFGDMQVKVYGCTVEFDQFHQEIRVEGKIEDVAVFIDKTGLDVGHSTVFQDIANHQERIAGLQKIADTFKLEKNR